MSESSCWGVICNRRRREPFRRASRLTSGLLLKLFGKRVASSMSRRLPRGCLAESFFDFGCGCGFQASFASGRTSRTARAHPTLFLFPAKTSSQTTSLASCVSTAPRKTPRSGSCPSPSRSVAVPPSSDSQDIFYFIHEAFPGFVSKVRFS